MAQADTKTRILVLYYSMYGNVFKMAREVAAGVNAVPGVEVTIKTVAELLPEAALAAPPVKAAKEMQKDIPIAQVSDLAAADAIIFGSPTRFGNMAAQLRNFLDQTGGIWMEGALIGKPAGVFTSTASMHGGQETTLISMMLTLFHHGMLLLGVPYSVPQMITTQAGGTPYGPSHVAGAKSDRPLTEDEAQICQALGKRVAEMTQQLLAGKNLGK
jgi:NAD(P)H dehydrogenase (quinone)